MGIRGKKCMFLVQGEGRGHMTQSIAMKQILERAGIEVCEVIISKCKNRNVPDFYYEKMKGTPVTPLESINMVVANNNRKIRPLATFFGNMADMPRFYRSVRIIEQKVKEQKPDFIVNFFEPLSGFYYALCRPKVPLINVAHHFMYHHPEFIMPKGKYAARFGIRFYAWIASIGSAKRLALSFYPFPDNSRKRIFVVPPLLREEAINYPTQKGNYLLVYLLNSGYLDDIAAWNKENPDTELHCFMGRKGITEVEEYRKNLFVHPIDDKKFLEMMAGAKGLVTTAGFESVCEAMYMNKPVLMVPVEDHYEQYCNSQDAVWAGAGVYSKKFAIHKLLTHIANVKQDNENFKNWVSQSPDLMLRQVYSVIYAGDNVRQMFPLPAWGKKVEAGV